MQAEAFLGIEISSVPIVAVTPALRALYEEDLVDAFEYAGLQLASIYISGSVNNLTLRMKIVKSHQEHLQIPFKKG
jgi:hypothetical protein